MLLSIKHCLFAFCAAVSIQSPSPSMAVTADELATHLGISSWNTVVDLPLQSYTVELYEFQNGKIGKRLWGDQSWSSESPEGGGRIHLSFLVSVETGKLKGTAISALKPDGATVSISFFSETLTSVPSVRHGLPAKFKEGDYFMGADELQGSKMIPFGDKRPAEEFVKDFKSGLVLRVRMKGK